MTILRISGRLSAICGRFIQIPDCCAIDFYSGEGSSWAGRSQENHQLADIIDSAEPAVAKRSHKQKALPISIYIPLHRRPRKSPR